MPKEIGDTKTAYLGEGAQKQEKSEDDFDYLEAAKADDDEWPDDSQEAGFQKESYKSSLEEMFSLVEEAYEELAKYNAEHPDDTKEPFKHGKHGFSMEEAYQELAKYNAEHPDDTKEPYKHGKHGFSMEEAYQELAKYNAEHEAIARAPDFTPGGNGELYKQDWVRFKDDIYAKRFLKKPKLSRKVMIKIFGSKYGSLASKDRGMETDKKNYSLFLSILAKYYLPTRNWTFKKEFLNTWKTCKVSSTKDVSDWLSDVLISFYSFKGKEPSTKPLLREAVRPAVARQTQPKMKKIFSEAKPQTSRTDSILRQQPKPGQTLDYYESLLKDSKKK